MSVVKPIVSEHFSSICKHMCMCKVDLHQKPTFLLRCMVKPFHTSDYFTTHTSEHDQLKPSLIFRLGYTAIAYELLCSYGYLESTTVALESKVLHTFRN